MKNELLVMNGTLAVQYGVDVVYFVHGGIGQAGPRLSWQPFGVPESAAAR